MYGPHKTTDNRREGKTQSLRLSEYRTRLVSIGHRPEVLSQQDSRLVASRLAARVGYKPSSVTPVVSFASFCPLLIEIPVKVEIPVIVEIPVMVKLPVKTLVNKSADICKR
jgi:hypothetical protein